MRRLNDHASDISDERNDTIINTISSHVGNQISNEGVPEAHSVYKSVNVSVNNLLVKNKSGMTGKNVNKPQILDLKQILEQRGSKCTCKIGNGRSASYGNN